MTLPTDIEREKATHKPTLKDLIFAPPAFFCFSANAQLAHLALPDTQTDPSQSQKSQFFAYPRLRKQHFEFNRYECSKK
jgi:hypothetical protein